MRPSELVDRAIERLLRAGFQVESDVTYPESFGNRNVVLTRDNLLIECTRDRSAWGISVGFRDWDRKYQADVWAACLDGTSIPLDVSSVKDELEFFVRREDVIATADGNAGLQACLSREELGWLQRRSWAGRAGPTPDRMD